MTESKWSEQKEKFLKKGKVPQKEKFLKKGKVPQKEKFLAAKKKDFWNGKNISRICSEGRVKSQKNLQK